MEEERHPSKLPVEYLGSVLQQIVNHMQKRMSQDRYIDSLMVQVLRERTNYHLVVSRVERLLRKQ